MLPASTASLHGFCSHHTALKRARHCSRCAAQREGSGATALLLHGLNSVKQLVGRLTGDVLQASWGSLPQRCWLVCWRTASASRPSRAKTWRAVQALAKSWAAL